VAPGGTDDGCLSELNIPVLVDGRWVGSIGFSDYVRDHEWDDDDIGVLTTAAAMIGSFWERARATQRLEELIRSKDRFLASISHEIRTPLTAVLGFSQVLRDEVRGLPPGGSEMIGIVAQQAQEISDIVEDLLAAARADIDALAVTHEAVVLRREAESVASARAALNIVIEESDVVALADPARVRQVIRCLVSNAARYGGDRIEIRFGRDGDRATVVVADSGSGVASGHERHIFEAFHRVADADGTTRAVGLGLFVSHHLASLMGGRLTYRREAGWTLFELDLPRASNTADDGTGAREGEIATARPIAPGGDPVAQPV
jgi:signal transduction histidine kinase